MKEYGIKTLFVVLILGIMISIIQMFTGSGGSSLESVAFTLAITSLIIFVSTIFFLLISFKENISNISIWLLLIISFPLTFISIKHYINEMYLRNVSTTTPKEFLYNVKIEEEKYISDKKRIKNLTDSLIKKKVVFISSKLALRHFDGQDYNDTIDRSWSINLPLKIDYKETIIDTLFYSSDKENIIAGLLVFKVFNEYKDYPNGAIDFKGYGFIYNNNSIKPIDIMNRSISNYNSYHACSKDLRTLFFSRLSNGKNRFNINDNRFLETITQLHTSTITQ